VQTFLPPRAKFLPKDAYKFEVLQTTLLIILLRFFNQYRFTCNAVFKSDLIKFVAENSCLYKYGDPQKDSTATFSFVFVLKQFENSFHESETIFSAFVVGSVFPFSIHFLNSKNLSDKQ
jgi:hypothetical protein